MNNKELTVQALYTISRQYSNIFCNKGSFETSVSLWSKLYSWLMMYG